MNVSTGNFFECTTSFGKGNKPRQTLLKILNFCDTIANVLTGDFKPCRQFMEEEIKEVRHQLK